MRKEGFVARVLHGKEQQGDDEIDELIIHESG